MGDAQKEMFERTDVGFDRGRLIGEGGSSEVFRGEDPQTGAAWAVKLLRKFGAAEAATAQLADRAFEREIAVLAR